MLMLQESGNEAGTLRNLQDKDVSKVIVLT